MSMYNKMLIKQPHEIKEQAIQMIHAHVPTINSLYAECIHMSIYNCMLIKQPHEIKEQAIQMIHAHVPTIN